jgi:septum formation protein
MLILGSSSQFRKAQLSQLNVEFKTHSPEIEEESIKESTLSPQEISQELSLQKAREVFKHYPSDVVIGADQVLAFNGEIFSKPGTEKNAIKQIQKLNGKTHELITSYAIISGKQEIVRTVISKMTMKNLTDEQIENYIKQDQPLHSCGAYKLETLGIALFEKIDCPDHSAIIGLPLITLTSDLMNLGIKVL